MTLQGVGTNFYSSTGLCHTGRCDPLVFSLLAITIVSCGFTSRSSGTSPICYVDDDVFYIASPKDSLQDPTRLGRKKYILCPKY